MLELPYGVADFHRIRTRGMVYVDRTAHIRDVEALGDVLVFLRPRHFGKSLWLQTLANYYDVRRADEFDELFGGLAAGQRPPASRYFILQWNLSKVDASGSVEQISESIREHVSSQAKTFEAHYGDRLPGRVEVEGSSAAVLDSILRVVEKTALDTMRTWYNGYLFTRPSPGTGTADQVEPVYNPTNVLYFLMHLARWGTPPEQLYDENLRTDRGELNFLARTSAGAGVVEKLTEGDGTVAIPRLAASFSLDNLTARLQKDRSAVASLLYYMGLLTLVRDVPLRLKIPNLVVKKLFLDRLLEIFLPDLADSSVAREIAMTFYRDGELGPLLGFFESRLLPVLSNRDRGAAAKESWQSGSGMNEMVVKTLFLSLLFDDTRYVTFSELELSQGYADLCLLVRPEMRQQGFFDVLFEFKLVRRKELGKKGRELSELDDEALRGLPPVATALAEARDQAAGYRAALVRRFGAETLSLRCYAVVAVGLERILGEEVVHARVAGRPQAVDASPVRYDR